jgi:uncharacterized MnhB-related membrane protein
MTIWVWLMDAALGIVLVGVAVRALATPRLFESVALFIVFGIFVSLAWVRLGAPDIALAEAGIGTGFTGALCVAALVRLRRAATNAVLPEARDD